MKKKKNKVATSVANELYKEILILKYIMIGVVVGSIITAVALSMYDGRKMVVASSKIAYRPIKCPMPYPDYLWKGLIAEAVSEGEEGMYAVACCYRNRLNKGMPLGCVGLQRKDLNEFVAQQGKRYEITSKAVLRRVFEEAGSDITNGSTHYENVEAFGKPEWTATMIPTIKVGKHTFYKEKLND